MLKATSTVKKELIAKSFKDLTHVPTVRPEAFSRLSSLGMLPAETGAIKLQGFGNHLKLRDQMKYQ